MTSDDTIKLLKECDAGTKMAISSIDEVLEDISASKLKDLLSESKEHHERIELEIHKLLDHYNEEEKEPTRIAKSMSWMKTNMKMSMDNSDATVADLMTDGCDMGVKSLCRYMNQYCKADESAMKICQELVEIEEKLGKDMREFL